MELTPIERWSQLPESNTRNSGPESSLPIDSNGAFLKVSKDLHAFLESTKIFHLARPRSSDANFAKNLWNLSNQSFGRNQFPQWIVTKIFKTGPEKKEVRIKTGSIFGY